MSFRDRSFNQRLTQMGDAAEGVFEDTYPQGFTRFGLNRPPIRLSTVPEFIRFTPDYLTSKGLVEVQGFGRDQTVKMKLNKWKSMWEWHEIFRVDLFLWDSKNRRYGWARLPELAEAFAEHGELRAFPEGTEYYAIHANQIPIVDEWTDR
jgi:hypothetical protein